GAVSGGSRTFWGEKRRWWGVTRELCKRCWRFNPVGFSVPDEVWNRVVPEEFRNRVLCIMCFDYFATEHGVEWAQCVELYPVSGVMHLRGQLVSNDAEGSRRHEWVDG